MVGVRVSGLLGVRARWDSGEVYPTRPFLSLPGRDSRLRGVKWYESYLEVPQGFRR